MQRSYTLSLVTRQHAVKLILGGTYDGCMRKAAAVDCSALQNPALALISAVLQTMSWSSSLVHFQDSQCTINKADSDRPSAEDKCVRWIAARIQPSCCLKPTVLERACITPCCNLPVKARRIDCQRIYSPGISMIIEICAVQESIGAAAGTVKASHGSGWIGTAIWGHRSMHACSCIQASQLADYGASSSSNILVSTNWSTDFSDRQYREPRSEARERSRILPRSGVRPCEYEERAFSKLEANNLLKRGKRERHVPWRHDSNEAMSLSKPCRPELTTLSSPCILQALRDSLCME